LLLFLHLLLFRLIRASPPPPPTQAKPALQAVSASPSIHNTQRTGLDFPRSLEKFLPLTQAQLASELLSKFPTLDVKRAEQLARQYAEAGQQTLDALAQAGLNELEFWKEPNGNIILQGYTPENFDPRMLPSLNKDHNGRFNTWRCEYQNGVTFHDSLAITTGLAWPRHDTFWGKIFGENPYGFTGNHVSPPVDGENLEALLRNPKTTKIAPRFLTFPPLSPDDQKALVAQAQRLNEFLSRKG
jgi:hypothetical protein